MTKEELRIYNKAYHAMHREEHRVRDKVYHAAHKEEHREYMAAYRSAHLAERRVYGAMYQEKIRVQNKTWREANRSRLCAHTALRTASKLQATPIWADLELIRDMYLEAEYQQMEVDHIVPLRGKNVCGLHCEGNLQLLTKQDNRIKGNRFNEKEMLNA